MAIMVAHALFACLVCAVLNFVLCVVPPSGSNVPTTPPPKTTIQYGGWKPIRPGPSLRSSRRTDRWASGRFVNGSDRATADTTKSFLLVYPPKPGKANEARSARNKAAFGPPANTETPLRTYPPTTPRRQKLANGGNGATRTSQQVHGKSKAQSADPSTLSTSNHHVQIQLLDGYIVPPQQGTDSSKTNFTVQI